MFHRPISSVVQGGTLVSQSILDGQPVYIYADYERRVAGFEKTASGGRLRQQIGDHVALGGTYVQDDREAGSYEMQGLDAVLRVGKGTRLIGEVADSTGTESTLFVSSDGGLSYNEIAPGGVREGMAWKAAAEIDVGEWFQKPDLQLSGQEFLHGNLPAGRYYWRVASMMVTTEGHSSPVRRLDLVLDDQPPELEVDFPRGPVHTSAFQLHGIAEPGTCLFIKDQSVVVGPSGEFEHTLELDRGLNVVVVEAVDAAGNITYRSQRLNAKY